MPLKMTRLTLRGGEGDKRRFTRLPSDLKADLTLVPDPQVDDSYYTEKQLMSSVVSVTNLSATGLHIVSLVKYEPHQHVWLAIDIAGQETVIRGKIVRRVSATSAVKEAFGYGVQFLKSDFAPAAVTIILEYLQTIVKKPVAKAAA